ncbi:helix-turn-helix transcriptional regulator [Streptomyces sp. SID3343]|uniref:helix-turn-helix domain-containing protein n=1 Tax=Streptomyces sp. SID3343 TaxID=2690260 RepID=UPI001367DE79|nr:helix-turn-helix transcriptional regulator [Streptomyces sp. SID3343]MYV98385.1 helix-turn-helix domain-containing protein [Streptomyces sp. SID3343]
MSAEQSSRDLSFAPVLSLSGRPRKPVVAARLVGAALRTLRESRGQAIKDVAHVIRASHSKISRMERGENPQRELDVLDLMAAYGVTDEQVVAGMKELVREANAPVWWHKYNDVLPGWFRRLIGMEDSAIALNTYEMNLVPGLLQTRAYARAIVKAGLPEATDEQIERRVELRILRQELLRGEAPPRIKALLDESVLLRPRGGFAVMVEQLTHLKYLAEHDIANVRIVSFGKAANLTPPTSVTHLTFGPGGPPELIYLEHIDSAHYLTGKDDLRSYKLVLEELGKVAETRTRSMEMVDEAITRFSR